MLDFSDAVMDDALVSRGMFELELEMYGVRSREKERMRLVSLAHFLPHQRLVAKIKAFQPGTPG